MNTVTTKPSVGAGRLSKSMYGWCSVTVTSLHSTFVMISQNRADAKRQVIADAAGRRRTPAGRGLNLAVRAASPLLPDLVARGGEDVPLRAELIEVLPVRIAGLLVA